MGHDEQSLGGLIRADIAAVRRHRDGQLYPHLFPNLFAVVMFRIAHALGERKLGALAHALCLIIGVLTGAEIGWRAQIGPGLFLEHPVGVVIPGEVSAGRNLSMGAGALLGSTFGESRTRPTIGFPTLGDYVQVLARASVIGPVHIGDGALVGAHALVLEDVPPHAVARGVPARSYVDGRLADRKAPQRTVGS